MNAKLQPIVSVRLDEKTLTALDRLALTSGRPRGSVIKRLILAAAQEPRYLAAIGTIDNRSVEVAR
jgi:predicted transcriptional regulator